MNLCTSAKFKIKLNAMLHTHPFHKKMETKITCYFNDNKINLQLTFTWFQIAMDIHIFGMFLNLNQLNKRDHLDEIRRIVQLERLPMLWQQRNVADLDHSDDESVEWQKNQKKIKQKKVKTLFSKRNSDTKMFVWRKKMEYSIKLISKKKSKRKY